MCQSEWEEHRERLPDLVVQARGTNFLDVNRIHPAQQIESLLGDGPQHTDREARPRERMPAHDLLRQAELPADLAHFVLEELAQRLDQLPGKGRSQAPHLMMRFDRDRLTAERPGGTR